MPDGCANVLRMVEPTVFDIGRLSANMRPDEIEQWCALSGLATYDADLAAKSILPTMGPFAFCIIDANSDPVVAGGFIEQRKGVFQTWMIGTDAGWEQHWRGVTRLSRRCFDELLKERAHRIETVALASRTAAREWYERGLGMTFECIRPGYFADGQAGAMYSRVRP